MPLSQTDFNQAGHVTFVADQSGFQQALRRFLLNHHPGSDRFSIDRLSPAVADRPDANAVLVRGKPAAFELLDQGNAFITDLHHRLQSEN